MVQKQQSLPLLRIKRCLVLCGSLTPPKTATGRFPWYKKKQTTPAPFEFNVKVRVLLTPHPAKNRRRSCSRGTKRSKPPLPLLSLKQQFVFCQYPAPFKTPPGSFSGYKKEQATRPSPLLRSKQQPALCQSPRRNTKKEQAPLLLL